MSAWPKDSLRSYSKLYCLAISETGGNYSLSLHSSFLDFCQEEN